jgi:hypothetical protein
MASMKRPRLKTVEALANCTLALTFINDMKYHLDLSSDIAAFPGLQPLRDPNIFKQAEIGDDGWTVEWSGPDIQIGADTLYLDAKAQAALTRTRGFSLAGAHAPGCPWHWRPRRWVSVLAALAVTPTAAKLHRAPSPLRVSDGTLCRARPKAAGCWPRNVRSMALKKGSALARRAASKRTRARMASELTREKPMSVINVITD